MTHRIIDAHGHVGWYGYSPAKLVQNMDEHGIERMWLLSWGCPAAEIDPFFANIFPPGATDLPFAHVAAAVEQFPDRFIAGYAPDPRTPDFLQRLQGAVEYHGVRVCGELKVRVMLDDPRCLELFHYCGEAGLPVIFHMDVPLPRGEYGRDPGYWYCCDWDNLARVLELFPRTHFIGHAPGFWREISGDADASTEMYPRGPVTPDGKLWAYLDRYSNLYCDLSAGSALGAITRDPEAGKRFLLRYADRCLFGRDWFDNRLYEALLGYDLPEDALVAILAGNALRLVPLG